MINFKQDILEIILKKDDTDKLWQLLRLLQKFPDLINSSFEEKFEKANKNIKSEIEKELKDKFQDLSLLLGRILETELKPNLEKETENAIIIINKELERLKNIKVINGKDGKTPIKGKDYFDGKNADEDKIINEVIKKIPKPEKGKDADEIKIIEKVKSQIPIPKDGSSDKPEDISKKLNTLENVLKISVISGLEERLNKIAWESRGKVSKGGGMGDWVHQSFNTSSSTTIINLSDNIAANGFAILAFYNGQFIVRGTHYTQSGNMLTLTFTPEDNTNIDVAFVKG